MKRAIRKHLRDFLALLFLLVLALGVGGYILSNQRFYLPGWVPVVGTDFYTLEAELPTAQAVVPGQGQTVNIAGVKVGDIGKVELEDGVAVVEMKIQRRSTRRSTATPRSCCGRRPASRTCTSQLDPGTAGAGRAAARAAAPGREHAARREPRRGARRASTRDTRDYLRVLLNAGGEALGDDRAGRPAVLGRRPARDVQALRAHGARRARRSRSSSPSGAATCAAWCTTSRSWPPSSARKDSQLAALVDSANANFEALARQDEQPARVAAAAAGHARPDRDHAAQGRDARGASSGPTLQDAAPRRARARPVAARRRGRSCARPPRSSARSCGRSPATCARPCATCARAAEDLAVVTPRLTRTFKVLNSLLNTLAYNPPGSEEGYLFWASWANHAGATIFSTQDAHGPIRRGLVYLLRRAQRARPDQADQPAAQRPDRAAQRPAPDRGLPAPATP